MIYITRTTHPTAHYYISADKMEDALRCAAKLWGDGKGFLLNEVSPEVAATLTAGEIVNAHEGEVRSA